MVIIVAVAVLLTAGGVGAARIVKSPGEKAAEAKPPRPSVITAVVERRILADTVVIRGTVTSGQTTTITAQAGGGKEDGAARSVVTGVRVKTGDSVKGGQTLLEISGRPLFVLAGSLPVYRDLKPGSSGPDVKQLQAALRAVGHKTSPDDPGVYGSATRKAVAAFYKARGYEAPEAGTLADIAAAEDRLTQAERALARTKTPAAPGSSNGATASPQESASGTTEQQRSYATEDLAKAREALTALKAASGAMIPASEVAFVASFPARVDAVRAAVGNDIENATVTLSTGDLVVRGSLAAHERGLVRPPMPVRILSELSGVEADGTVRSVADQPARDTPQGDAAGGNTAPVGDRGFEVIVAPTTTLDPKLAGQDVRLTVQAASSGTPVLVVPVSAVSAGADGRTVVTTVDATGTQHRVEVRPGTSGDGSVQVTPLDPSNLGENDHVVVGVKPADAAR